MIKTHRNAVLLSLLILTGGASARAADIQTITHGREVDLQAHLVPGKYVLFDFYADWCGPCRALEPGLEDLAGRHAEKLALRKVDIINWDSAVTRQYRISSIPYMVLYGPDGAKLAAGDPGSVIRRLESDLGGGSGLATRSGGGSSMVPVLAIAVIFAVTVGLLVWRRQSPAAMRTRAEGAAALPPVDTAADPGDPAIWFVLLQGSLDGPFTRAQLAELVRRGVLDATATARRRGDASWKPVKDVLA